MAKTKIKKITTEIPELLTMPISEAQLQAVLGIVGAAAEFEGALADNHELNLRFRIEIAAAFLASLIEHAENAADDDPDDPDPDEVIDTMVNLATERAFEVYEQGHG